MSTSKSTRTTKPELNGAAKERAIKAQLRKAAVFVKFDRDAEFRSHVEPDGKVRDPVAKAFIEKRDAWLRKTSTLLES